MDQRMVAFACRCSMITASGSKNFTHWVGLTPAPTNRPLALSPFCRIWKPSSTRSLAIKTYQTSNVSVPLSLYPFHWTYMPSIYFCFSHYLLIICPYFDMMCTFLWFDPALRVLGIVILYLLSILSALTIKTIQSWSGSRSSVDSVITLSLFDHALWLVKKNPRRLLNKSHATNRDVIICVFQRLRPAKWFYFEFLFTPWDI